MVASLQVVAVPLPARKADFLGYQSMRAPAVWKVGLRSELVQNFPSATRVPSPVEEPVPSPTLRLGKLTGGAWAQMLVAKGKVAKVKITLLASLDLVTILFFMGSVGVVEKCW